MEDTQISAAPPLMGIELHHIYKSTHSQSASY